MSSVKFLTVLGATGSIGQSTLDVVARHPDRYGIFALTAHSQYEKLLGLCLSFNPRYAVIGADSAADKLQIALKEQGCSTEVLAGEAGLVAVSEAPEVDMVMAAIVGAAGLVPTLAAARAGKRVLLANKESLVTAGSLFMAAVRDGGATLLPVDSEHNAIFQCLPSNYTGVERAGVSKILLTASGGPFRGWNYDRLASVTPEQACAHPNWSMGQKISVDSASLMNKGLELIEACWLFDVSPEQIDVVIHPQSIIHSMVQYTDGSVLAQMGNPDMRTPIAHAMAWPERIDAGVAPLDLVATAQLQFEAPDEESFPCLALARQAISEGGSSPAVLNAANEVTVAAFLEGRIGFNQIGDINGKVLKNNPLPGELESLEHVQQADSEARQLAKLLIARQL
ncbi:MAG: 1-deoxy-D-xylulose-5-phosphate reductoisomerase [Cellvibrionaceae bacterium]